MGKIKEKNFLSIVVHVHNDEQIIADFANRIISLVEKKFEHFEIIFVNDFSTDNSVKIIKNISAKAKMASLSIINLSYYHGLETSMNAGVDFSIGDFVFEIDTCNMDWKDDDFMHVYQKALDGYDIVSASPNRKQKISSCVFYWLYNKFSVSNITIQTESFRILSRRAINRINNMTTSIPYRKAIYSNAGLKTTTLKYDVNINSFHGMYSCEVNRYRRKLAFETLVLFTDIGYFITKIMTNVMLFISAFMFLYTSFIYFSAHPVEGWTTTLLFLSISFLGIFFIFSIILKYLQILINLNFKRTQYTFESIEKLNC